MYTSKIYRVRKLLFTSNYRKLYLVYLCKLLMMGGSFSYLFGRIICRKPYRIVVFGLDNVGKTSLLFRLKTDTLLETVPTIGCNVEVISLKHCATVIWDVGGGFKMPPLWRHHYEGASGIVFVLDASDKDRAPEAAYNLNSLLASSSRMEHIVLILANKQDLGNCLTEEEIRKIFGVRDNVGIRWRIQPTSIKEWYGVTEGMDWLSKEISK